MMHQSLYNLKTLIEANPSVNTEEIATMVGEIIPAIYYEKGTSTSISSQRRKLKISAGRLCNEKTGPKMQNDRGPYFSINLRCAEK